MKATLILILIFFSLHAGDDKACIACHTEQHKAWLNSDHDLAMQKATDSTVLGDFDNATFVYNNITTTFYKKGSKFMVQTDGPDGRLHDYEISHTFGVRPLQQYLIPFPDGRFQVLDIAWDARSRAEGGQHWYHLHPHDEVTASDMLHLSGPNLNWNFMCADCHSTKLKKNYDIETKRYHTSYKIINVSCTACHGEAEAHLQWTKTQKGQDPGLALPALHTREWSIDENGKPKLLGKIDRTEVQTCARCHSRRSQLDDDFKPGEDFDEHHVLATLDEVLYYPDGQIKDEVYVYGSFIQSKMYEAGVTCSDCHDPHTLKQKAEGDQVCFQCHSDSNYTSSKHHHHKKGSSGASCIACHMPSRVYMGVDTRYDHSFRIPRPDVSERLGTPDACIACHKEKQSSWAAASLKKWYGKIPVGYQDFAYTLDALHNNSDTAQQLLYDVLMKEIPPIAKASAVEYLGRYPSRQTFTTVLQLLQDDNALVRNKALSALESFPANLRIEHTFNMLDDPVKLVRVEAARQLSAIPAGEVAPEVRAKLDKGIEEYRQTLLFNADRAESQSALGTLYANLGKREQAKRAYEEALRLQPYFANAYINFADFYQRQGNEKAAYEILKQGLKAASDTSGIHHALGLWQVRDKAPDKAHRHLKKAAGLAPDNARYQYVYAVALAQEDPSAAIKVLEASLNRHTGDIPTLYALSSYYDVLGKTMIAQQYRQKAEALRRFVPKVAQ